VLVLESIETQGGRAALHGVSLAVHVGEVLGVAGVEGNGQQALVHNILGLVPLSGGRVLLGGRNLEGLGPAERRRAGLGCVLEDRLGEGLVPAMRVDENLALGMQRDLELGRGPWLDPARLRDRARALLVEYDVQPPRVELPAAALSGGNQQRLLLARELARSPRALVLAQPTRGVDVAGIQFIHDRIRGVRDRGCAVLLVSADLAEILALADRVAVLFEGRVAGLLPVGEAEPRRLGLLMTGAREPSA
jgi:simple sugar transport system ATP-binding protein